MKIKILTLAAALCLAVPGAAFAQMRAGGSAESNMNNPGSVKSPTQKRMGGQKSMMGKRHMSHRMRSRRSRM